MVTKLSAVLIVATLLATSVTALTLLKPKEEAIKDIKPTITPDEPTPRTTPKETPLYWTSSPVWRIGKAPQNSYQLYVGQNCVTPNITIRHQLSQTFIFNDTYLALYPQARQDGLVGFVETCHNTSHFPEPVTDIIPGETYLVTAHQNCMWGFPDGQT
jgi:hypothetical protein